MATQSLAFPAPLSERYKPQTIAEFVGLEKQKKILLNLAANPRNCGLLFAGSTGTGKTSLAFAFARAIEAEVHHLPSQDAKLETLQSVVAMCHRVPYDFETGRPCRFHLVLIDEADLLGSASQNYLLSKLDGSSPCPSTVFILTANSTERFEDRLLSRLIQLPKFSGYGIAADVRSLLARAWAENAGDAPQPDFDRVPTSNVREALAWLEVELLSA